MHSFPALVALVAYLAVAAHAWEPSPGNYTFDITTANAEAKRLFTQGLNLEFNFMQTMAVTAFQSALSKDPTCAMCAWGVAYALGPFINNPTLDPATCGQAYEAAQVAANVVARSPTKYSAKERALVAAMAARYPSDPNGNQTATYQQYRNLLGVALANMPQDVDIATFYVESTMVLYSDNAGYHFFDSKTGETPFDIACAIKLLETVMNTSDNPFAKHLYIHITEPSMPGFGPNNAGRAFLESGLLEDQVKANTNAQHLQHMPVHTNLRVGHYHTIVEDSLIAIASDTQYLQNGGLPYAPAHNMAFLIYGAVMDGQFGLSLEWGLKLREHYRKFPERADGPGGDGGWNIQRTTMLRAGNWSGVLADDDAAAPSGYHDQWYFARVVGHYARAIAFYHLHHFDQASLEASALANLLPSVDPGYADLAQVAQWLVQATKLVFQDKNPSAAAALLQQATIKQEGLAYDEPPSFHVPVRQCWGQVLLSLRTLPAAAQAETVFRDDLKLHFPNNPYSLWGLVEAMKLQPGKYTPDELLAAEANRDAAWAHGDIPLSAACAMLSTAL